MKDEEVKAMQNFVKETMNKIDPNVEIKFESDEELMDYGKGEIMNLDDIKNLSKGDVVWIDHLDCGRPRFIGPMRFSSYSDGEYLFEDGSSFMTPVHEDDWDDNSKSFFACDHQLTFYKAEKING